MRVKVYLGGGSGYVNVDLPLADIIPGLPGQILQTDAGADSAVWNTMSGDATISPTGVVTVSQVSGSTTAVVTSANTPYTALPTDSLIEVESAGAFREVLFEAAPSTGKRHTVKWWSYAGGGDPLPEVSGNGKQIEASAGGTPFAGLSGLVATTNLPTPGGSVTWEYDGTQWVIVASS